VLAEYPSARSGARLVATMQRLAVLEARMSVERLRAGDFVGAHMAAERAEVEARATGWLVMAEAAMRMQRRANFALLEQSIRDAQQAAQADYWCGLAMTDRGLW